MSRGSPTTRRVLLALAVPLALLLAAEGLCRALGVRPSRIERPYPGLLDLGLEFADGVASDFFNRHSTRFFTARPDARGVFRTDAMGFRGGERPSPHDRLLRVALIGDSCTFGFGVRYGATFAARLEERLARALPDLDVDVVAAACPGYSTFQNRLDLDERVLPLGPDVVVLCASGFNDSVGAVGFEDAVWGAYAGELPPLLRDSRLIAALERLLAPITGRLLIGDPEQAAAAVREGRAPDGPRVPLPQFVANVRWMVERVRAAGAVPALLVLPQPQPDLERAPARRAYADALRDVARDLALPWRDGAEVVPVADRAAFFDTIHFDETAHARLGDALADLLLAGSLLPGRKAASGDSAPPPALEAIEPARGDLEGGGTLVVRGSGLTVPARFTLGGEPMEVAHVSADGSRAELVQPPLGPGEHVLRVQTPRGAAWLAGTFTAVGPELRLDVHAVRARLAVRGRPGRAVKLMVARALAPAAVMLGRTWHLDPAADPREIVDAVLPDTGLLELEAPLPAAGDLLFVQGLVATRDPSYAHIWMPTNVVEAEGDG